MNTRLNKLISFGVVSSGVILEHFDMMLVNLFATTMFRHFIGEQNANLSMILGFVGYGLSFLFKPLGAAVFGAIGDLLGRKPSMLISLFLMSVSTLTLGLIPSFEKIGILSAILFIVCRVSQGLSIGGEYGAAMTYSYEFTGTKKTTTGALVISATHLGGLFAAILASKYQAHFQRPFQIAGILGLLSLGLRSFLIESRSISLEKSTLKYLYKLSLENKSSYRKAFIVASALVFTFYASLIYLNEVIFQKNLANRAEIFHSNSILLGLWIIFPPILGIIVDRFNLSYRKVMLLGSVSVATVSGPVLVLASNQNSFQHMVFAQILIGFFHCIYCFATPRYLGDQFDSQSRNTGVALGYSLGASITAALTPLICHGVATLAGHIAAISVPILVISSLVAFQLFRELNISEKSYEYRYR